MSEHDEEVKQVLLTISDEGEQLDAIAGIHGWFSSSTSAANAIKAYMAGSQDAQTTVSQLADPIDEAYTTANHGRALREAERVAVGQRQYWREKEGEEEAEKRWGLPQAFPDLDADDNDDIASAEGLLWQLWFGVLLNARKIFWHDAAAQDRLIDLIRRFKQRPDPPLPTNATRALRNDWVWTSGKVWSTLLLLGPSAREHWNDSPGGNSGFSALEVRSWLNCNAFVARLTITGLFDFWLYCIWALRDALETDAFADNGISKAERTGLGISEVAVWMRTAGPQMWEHVRESAEEEVEEVQHLDPKMPFEALPWKSGDYRRQEGFTVTRWLYWKARLRLLANRETLTDGAKHTAAETARLMDEIERATVK